MLHQEDIYAANTPVLYKPSPTVGHSALLVPYADGPSSDPLDSFICIIRDFCSTLEKGLGYEAIMLYYGIDNTNITLQQIGEKNNVTRERARQLKELNLSSIKKLFQGSVVNGLRCDPIVLGQVSNFRDKFLKYILLSEDKVKEILGHEGILLSKDRESHLRLFFSVFNVESYRYSLKDTIYVTRGIKGIKKFFKYFSKIKKYFKDDTVVSVDTIKNKIPIHDSIIQAFIDIMPGVEKVGTQEYRTKYSELSSVDVAHAVLASAGKPLHHKDILETVNKLRGREVLTIPLCIDHRFKSVGLTGMWALKDDDVVTDFNYEIIKRVLKHFNCPCSLKKIYKYTKTLRPEVSLDKIYALIARLDKEHFLRLSDGRVILSSWKSKYKDQCRDIVKRSPKKYRIASGNFDLLLCEVLKGNVLSANEIAKQINAKTGLDIRSCSSRVYLSDLVLPQNDGHCRKFKLKDDYIEVLNKRLRDKKDTVLNAIKDLFKKEGKDILTRSYIVKCILAEYKVSMPFVYRLLTDETTFKVDYLNKKYSYVSLKA